MVSPVGTVNPGTKKIGKKDWTSLVMVYRHVVFPHILCWSSTNPYIMFEFYLKFCTCVDHMCTYEICT